MKPDADVLVSMSLGKNLLNFNNSWFLDLPTVERLFAGWQLVDRASGPGSECFETGDGFTKDASVDTLPFGDYLLIFLHFRHAPAGQSAPREG